MTMPRNTFAVIKQIDPPTARPYRIIEMYLTCDGMRSRLTNRSFTKEDEALKEATALRNNK